MACNILQCVLRACGLYNGLDLQLLSPLLVGEMKHKTKPHNVPPHKLHKGTKLYTAHANNRIKEMHSSQSHLLPLLLPGDDGSCSAAWSCAEPQPDV
jgi:hypothetical protein